MRKVMVLEPNDYHGEVIAGIVYYFVALGYLVDVLLRRNNYKEIKDVCKNEMIKLYIYDMETIDKRLGTIKKGEYDYLFLTSMEYIEHGKVRRFLDMINVPNVFKFGIYGYYHTTTLIRVFNDNMLQQKRLFCISEFQSDNKMIHVVSPHLFNFEKQTHILRGDKKKIACIGTVNDMELIYEALGEMSDRERKCFEIMHFGGKKGNEFNRIKMIVKTAYYQARGMINRQFLNKKYKFCISEKGRVDLHQLLLEIDESDFILMAFDYKTYKGLHYISSSTSGTRQIALGMKKPVICNEVVANIYGFACDAAITYAENRLYDGLMKAARIKNDEYKILCNKMSNIADTAYRESLDTLTKVVSASEMPI